MAWGIKRDAYRGYIVLNISICSAISFLISGGFFAINTLSFENLDGHVTFSTNARGEDIDRRIAMMKMITTSSLFPFVFRDVTIFVDARYQEPRATMRGKDMQVSSSMASDAEFLQVFVHELAHYVDISVLQMTAQHPDPSQEFYAISWRSAYIKHPGASLGSFVSGYAATNQYEDFAESFVWYVFHNEDFADRALRNEDLRKKYLFFAQWVFPDRQFQGIDFGMGIMPAYFWDTTKQPIFLQKYLYFVSPSI